MHDLAFADAARPTPVVVLNLPLRAYSLGHELQFWAARNPFMFLPRADFDALPREQQQGAIQQAVLICCDSYAYRERLFQPSLFGWRVRWHNFKVKLWKCRLRPEDYPLAIAEFRTYLEVAHSILPAPDPVADGLCADAGGYTPMSEMKGRSYGAPFLARLYAFILETIPEAELRQISHCHRSSTPTAWDFPFSFAEKLYATVQETKGNARIENFDELKEKLETEAYIAECKAAEAAAKAKTEETTEKNAGLATPPPDFGETESPPLSPFAPVQNPVQKEAQ